MNDQTLRKTQTDITEPQMDQQVETQVKQSRRPRCMTTVKLQWLAERARKCRQIQEQIQNGTYKVESRDVAKAVLGIYEDDCQKKSYTGFQILVGDLEVRFSAKATYSLK